MYSALLILAFMLLAHYRFKAQWQKVRDRAVEVEDYTVWVKGIAKVTTTKTAEQLREKVRKDCATGATSPW